MSTSTDVPAPIRARSGWERPAVSCVPRRTRAQAFPSPCSCMTCRQYRALTECGRGTSAGGEVVGRTVADPAAARRDVDPLRHRELRPGRPDVVPERLRTPGNPERID